MSKKKNQIATVKRLFKMLFSFYPKLLPLIIVLIIVNAVISSIPAIFQQNVVALIQEAFENNLPFEQIKPDVVRLISILAAFYLTSLIAGVAYNQLMAIFTQGCLSKIRIKLFDHMETLPIRFFDTHQRGDVMSYYTNDVESLRQMISQSFPQLMISAVTLTTILCIMFYYSIPMALVIILGAILSIFITKKIGGKSSKYFVAQQKNVAKTEGVIEEMINGQKVIKVFNHEDDTKADFDKVNEKGAPNFSISGLPFSIAVVVPFLGMSRQFAGNIQQISPQINSIVMGLAGARRVFELLDEESEQDEGYVELVNVKKVNGELVECKEKTNMWAWKHPHGDGTLTYTELKGDVRFFDVDFAYNPDKQILHNVSLYAKPGQKVAFVGATGAGKTTITNLINRFYDIADGKIRYDGININKIKKTDLRKSLGIVLQDTVLFTDTVMENIRYGRLDASDEECIAAAKLAGAHEFIRHLPDGYNTMLHGDGSNLSQGQCQLFAIARAAVADPPVMILDEATSSIDTRTESLVQSGMDKLMQGRTVFVIAHRLSTVKNSNVIIVLDHGRIIERGTHEELLEKKGQYYQLYTGAFELE